MNWTPIRFETHMRFHSELVEIVESRTTDILRRLGHKGWLKEFNEYQVTYEWNGSCHCHPNYEQSTFPASWVLAENWQELVDVEVAKSLAKRDAEAKANQQIKERQEREQYERLRKKFVEAT